MILFLFILCIFHKSAPLIYNLTVNFAESDIYIHLLKDSVEVRTSSASTSTNLLGKYDNLTDGKIYLHLGIELDPVEKSSLIFYVNTRPGIPTVGLDLTIENLNKSVPYPLYLKPHYQNEYNTTIIFHVESEDLLEFETYHNGADITVLRTDDNLLIKHVLPKYKRDNYLICYNSLQCPQREDITIQPEDTYLGGVTETHLQGYVNTLLSSTNVQNVKFYFIKPTETANLTSLPFKQINTIELIGISTETLQKVHFDDNSLTKLAQNWEIQNVQISASNEATLNFNTVFIKDTEKVFLEGPSICIDTACETRNSNSKNSPFLDVSEINLSIFEISPSFDQNGDITFLTKSDSISITSSENKEIASVPFLNTKETRILIKDAKNANKNKILIKANNANRPFNFYIENSDQIPIEFSDWNDAKYSSFLFTLYTEKSDDISVIYDSSQLFQYKHFNFERTRLFSEFPILENKFIFCLSADKCDQPEFDGPDILPISISGSSLSEVTEKFHSKLKEIENIDVLYFYLFLNKEDDGIEIDLLPYLKGESLEKVGFVNVDSKSSEILNVNIKSLPKTDNNFWEINKCNLILNSSELNYRIFELYSIDGGRITGEQININTTNYLENVDLTIDDQTVFVSSKSFRYLDNVVKNTDTMKIRVKSSTEHSLIFQHEDFVEETCDVEIDVESTDDDSIPVKIAENWHEIPTEKIGKIRINVPYSDEHVEFRSLTDKVNFEVYTKESQPRILAQIPVNCSQDKIVVCIESDQCSSQSTFILNEDEVFISTKRNDEFERMLNAIFSNKDKFYKFVRLSFIGRTSQDYEIPLQKIPGDKFEQLQLYGYQVGYNNAYISLNNETETNHIKNWLVNKVSFRQATGTTTTQEFEDLTVDGGSTGIFIGSYNVHIITAHFIIKSGWYVTGLSGLNNKVDRIIYEIYDLETKDYVIGIRGPTIYLDGSLTSYYTGNPTISNPVTKNLYFHINGPTMNNHTLYIKRWDNYGSSTYTNISLIIDEFEKVLPVRFECDGGEITKSFEYNFFTTNNGYYEIDNGYYEIDNGTCNSSLVNNSHYSPLPLPTQSKTPSESPSRSPLATPTESPSFSPSFSPSESPVATDLPSQSPVPLRTPMTEEEPTTIVSGSNKFEMTQVGFVDDKNETQEVDNETQKITTISFNQTSIEITESSVFISSQPLYFIAEKNHSTITINENVTQSNIGIYSDNNPTVIVKKPETPLSFMNRLFEGGNVTISMGEEENENEPINGLKFKELNNQKGQFIFNVPSSIESVSLTTLIMQYYSQLRINRYRKQSNLNLLENENEFANLIVLENFTITPQSYVTVNNLILNGSLFINTDSTLVVEESTEFSPSSLIEINVKDPKEYEKNSPIFSFGKDIKNKPSKIVFIPNNLNANVTLFEGKNLNCEDLSDILFIRQNGADIPLENESCYSDDGEIVLSFVEKKKEKSGKLPTGAIIGIVVGCVVVVAIIIIVAVLLVKRKKNKDDLMDDEDNMEMADSNESVGL